MSKFALLMLFVLTVAGTAEPPPLELPPSAPAESSVPAVTIPLDQLCTIGQQHDVAIDAVFGSMTGVRGQFVGIHQPTVAFAFEGFAGLALTTFGFGPSAGAGARAIFTMASNGRADAFQIAPGVGFLYVHTDVLFIDAWTRADAVGLTADVDFLWLHDFGRRCGWIVGTKLGLGVCVGANGDGQEWPGRVTPTVGFFAGLRF